MKSFYLLVSSLLALLLSTGATAQVVLLDQNFESGSLPSGWTRSQSTPSVGWEFGTSASLSSSFFPVPAHTKFAASNDDKHDNQATTQNLADRDMLITPSLDLSTLSAARLSFATFYPGAYGSVGTIEISTDGGSTWSQLYLVPKSADWQNLTVDLAAYLSYSDVKLAFVHNDGGEWADGFAIDDVKVSQPYPNDVELVSVDMPATSLIGSVPVTITVRNFGASTLNSFTFNWTSDGGTTVHTDYVNGLGLAPGATTTITHNATLNSLTSAEMTVEVELLLPNSQIDPSANNTASKDVDVNVGVVDRFVLIEEHTGAWCQYCPDGAVRLAAILDANPDVIGIAIHDGDAMEFTEGSTMAAAVTGGSYPSGTIDRVKFSGESDVAVSRTAWDTYTQLRKTEPSLVAIEADNTYNPATRELTVNVTANFLKTLTGDYRLNVFIVEDSVTGTGSGYDQVNYYHNVPGHPYNGAGPRIYGYVHKDVVRHFMGGAWGQAGVIPSTAVALTPYSHTFTYTLPAAWDESQVHLVVVAQKYGTTIDDREILNALKLGLNATNETPSEIASNVAAINVLNIINSNCGGGKEGEISLSAEGCSDCTFTWSNGQAGYLAFGLTPGVYSVTMENNSGISVTQSFTVYGPLMLTPNITYNNGMADVVLDIQGGTPPYTLGWSNGSSSTTQTGLAVGNYDVTVIDSKGCSTFQTLKVPEAPVGINNVANSINFSVYPNPTGGSVSIEADLANHANVTIQVYNTIGALVSETTLNGLAQVREVIDLSNEANGVYIVKMSANGTSGVRRLVLNR